MDSSRWTVLATLLLMVAACSGTEQGWGGSQLVVDGVTTTVSPPVPLADPSEVSTTELWSQSGPADGDVWGLPRSLGVSSRHAFVVDNQADQIHVVTLDGHLAGTLGRPGQGPGEYSRPVAAVPTGEGTFIVDGGNRRIDIIDDDLTLVRSFGSGKVAFSALPWGPSSVVVQGMAGDEVGWMVWHASGTPETVSLAPLTTESADQTDCYVFGTTRDRLLRLHCARVELSVFSRTGVVRQEISVDLPPQVATDEEIEDRVGRLRETLSQTSLPAAFLEQQVDAIRDGDRVKHMNRKVVAASGTDLIAIWSQNPEDYGSGAATLHLLSEEGIYLTSLEFERSWYDFTIRDGVLYSLEREASTGLVTLVARRIDVSASLLERAAAVTG